MEGVLICEFYFTQQCEALQRMRKTPLQRLDFLFFIFLVAIERVVRGISFGHVSSSLIFIMT